MGKKLSPVDTWNEIIEGLLGVRESWLKHKEVMSERPVIEELSLDAQKQLRFIAHRAPTFEKFLEAFMQRWRIQGGLDTMLIEVEETKTKKQTTKKKSPEEELLGD